MCENFSPGTVYLLCGNEHGFENVTVLADVLS